MASTHKTKAGFEVRWRFAGRQFNQSVGNVTQGEAEAIAGGIDNTINAIRRGWKEVPAEGDYETVKRFIFSGGQDTTETKIVATIRRLTLSDLFSLYEKDLTLSAKDQSSRKTEGYHITHVRTFFGQEREVETIALNEVQGYVDRRAEKVGPETIKKELQTFRFIWNWAFKRGHIKLTVPWAEKELTFPKSRPKEPFRTVAEIEQAISTRRLSEKDKKAWWDGLYLLGDELAEVLEFIQIHRTVDWLYPLVAMCIFTGCRRSEALRSEPTDFDFPGRTVQIREKKKNKKYEFTLRPVDLHTNLAQIMTEWLSVHQDGFDLITTDMTNDHLSRTLAKSEKWCKIKGYHVFRHSFASALASRGVDQRVINSLMGHGSEEMAKRYRHFARTVRQSAVDGLLG